MKKIFAALSGILITACVFAQVPQKMSYQAVIRDASGALIKSHVIGIRVSILQGSVTGAVVYTETQAPTSNTNGLISIEVGQEPGFTTINWSNGPFFIKTEIDPAGGTNYTAITGTSQLLSVPFALYSKTAEYYQENDPEFSSHPASGINSTSISNWNQAYTWGNHSNAGYLTSFSETDPGLAGNFDFTGASTGDMLKFNGTKWMRFTPDFSASSHTHQLANTSTNGFLAASDWNIFNSKENTLTFNGPLSRSGNTVSIPLAGNLSAGYLSSSDWNTFNSKESSLSFSGPLSRSGNTVSIPIANSISGGYLSSTDWTTFNNKGTFNLPSLTSGSLLFSDGTTITQDNSKLFWDNTNKRLGIGTMQPDFLLSLEKNTFAGVSDILSLDNLQSNNSANAASVNFRMRDNVGEGNKLVFARIRAISTTVIDPNQTGALAFDTRKNSTTLSEVMRIQGNNVGIGTSAPAYNLDVTGNSRITDQLIVKSINFTPANFSYFGFLNGNNFLYNNSGNIELMGIYNIWTNGGPLTFYNQGRVVFNSGNVGIGVTIPAEKLDVNGVVKATGGNSNNWNTAYSWGNHAVAGYQPLITAGTAGQYWRGDKSWQTLDKTAVGLGAVENTALSTWTGSANIVTLGTVSSGTWNAGAVTSTGAVTGSSIVKTGGTSDQFLKADGSVDNNTYMTAVQEAADEFTAVAGQTSFSLTQTPSLSSKIKMYINGIRISNNAYSNSGTTLTYNPVNNGSYTLTAGDRIQFDYSY